MGKNITFIQVYFRIKDMRHIIIALHSIRLALFFLFFRKSFDFHDRFSTKVQETFEVLGGGFIKIGQMMSMRVEFLPEVYCQKLRNCYDAAPAISHKDVQKCLKGIEQHFSSIEWEPIASASVAQVHKAELLTGEIVAVKILRPGIRKVIRKDLFWWNLLAFFVKKRFSRIPKKKWKEMVTYVCEHVVQETDLINEAKNMALMQRKVLTDRIMIPQVHSLLSSSSVLIMEFLA